MGHYDNLYDQANEEYKDIMKDKLALEKKQEAKIRKIFKKVLNIETDEDFFALTKLLKRYK